MRKIPSWRRPGEGVAAFSPVRQRLAWRPWHTASVSTKITVYSDFIWPFCFIGKSRVDRLIKEHEGLEVEWKGFEIHPETPADGTAKPPGPPERWKAANERIQAMAADAGIEMSRPDFRTSSHLALVADAFARDHGQVEPFHTNMLQAYWQQHRNIGAREVVLDVARASGLDADELARAIDDGRYEPELAEVYDECARYGINGVPTFIVGRYMVVGAQPYEVLEEALQRAQSEQ